MQNEGMESEFQQTPEIKAKNLKTEIHGSPSEQVINMSKLGFILAAEEENYSGNMPVLSISEGPVIVNEQASPAAYDRDDTPASIKIGEAALPNLWAPNIRRFIPSTISALMASVHEAKHFIDDQRGLLEENLPQDFLKPKVHYSSPNETDALLLAVKIINKAMGYELFRTIDTGQVTVNIKLSLLLKRNKGVYKDILKKYSDKFE